MKQRAWLREAVVSMVRGDTTLRQLRARMEGLLGDDVPPERSIRAAVRQAIERGALACEFVRPEGGRGRVHMVLRRREAA